jgi:L-alanine-DL-glutamate epimerase-like enolase superfamily enzyme
VDFHQRFDLAEAIRGCDLIKDLAPLFVEDPVRTEAFAEDLPILRRTVKVPIAAGEEWGYRWDFNKIVEAHDLDFVRATLPNVGGITEMLKIAAICETHFVGIVPHFTGPIATAALVHCLGAYSGPVLMEYNFQGKNLPHLPVCLDFRDGKLYPNDRPGLGVELDMKQLRQIAEVTQPGSARQMYYRPDGSITNW